MLPKYLYRNFSSILIVRAILAIIGFVITTAILILIDILQIFFVSPGVEAIFYSIGRLVAIVDIIFAFLMINKIRHLKSEAQHIHFTQFHSKLLVGAILTLVQFVFMFAAPILYPIFSDPFLDWNAYLIGFYLIDAAGQGIGFVGTLILMNAWAHFLRYSKMKQLSPRLNQNINLIKMGYLFLTISFLIKFLMAILIIPVNILPSNLMLIIGWSLLVANMLFMIIPPILLITGRFHLSKSIKNIRFGTSSEPTLGEYSDPQFRQIENNKKFCHNCGASALQEATFCPNCGNSF